MATKDMRMNKEIRAREIRLVDDDESKAGIMSLADALALAEEAGLDLVEIAPNANPPVCRILDYGKFKFDQEKRLKDQRKKQKVVKLKEVRMQPKIDNHDLGFKTKAIGGFLTEGNKVKVTIRFRGRELAHTEIGRDILLKVLDLLTEAEVQHTLVTPPRMEGRFMSMLLSPTTKK